MESAEGDYAGTTEVAGKVEDNSLGRLLALSDGVFAIAMTLLALDLRVPDLGDGVTEAALEHALAEATPSYVTFLLSFYVVAGYWTAHHRLMRSVTSTHPRLVWHTLRLLLVVAALPFPSSLLAEYASRPISLAVYGGVNAVAAGLIVWIHHDVAALGLGSPPTDLDDERRARFEQWGNLVVFLICIPSGFVFGAYGLWALALLFVSGRLPALWLLWRRSRRRGTPT
jgi:uncharacterized membrane protein